MTRDEFRQQMESYRQARERNPQLSYWQFKADLQNVINRINENSNANFVQRLQDYNRQTIPDWEVKGNIATHKLSYATDNSGNAIVYPNIQNINGQLYDFTNPKYNHGKWDSLDRAINTKDTIRMSPYEAQIFTQNYKQYYPKFDEGTDSDGVQSDLNFWERVVNNANKNGIQQQSAELTSEQKQALEKYMFELRRRSGAIQPLFTIEDAAGLTPIGNIQDGYDIYDNIVNNNYLTAAGLFGAALIPNFIGKYIKRPIERFAKQAQAKLNSYLTGEKPAVYNLLFSNEQQNVNDNVNEALSAYAEYLNNPTVRNRIIESGASDYLPAIDDFTNRVNNNSLDLRFPAIDTNDAAAVPHNPDYGDILFYDDYVANAAKPYVNNQIFDIPQHEASHLIERNVNPEDLTTIYNRFLADYGNMKSFDEWFDEGITNNSLPDWILPKGSKYNSFSKEGRDEIKQKAKDYYKYIYNPSEIHSYLGEATRNAWYNSDVLSDKLDLFPYRNLKELENSFTNPNAKQILNLYKDKKRLFRNLKNNLWLGIPAITTYNLLQTEEEKSN